MTQLPTQRSTKVIKRYANRKLYDTERSCYVTLEEISLMIKEGEDVRVVDNKTKDDLTAVTLAQIIVEEEKKVSRMPLKLLRSIIQSGNEALANLTVGPGRWETVGKAAQTLKDDVERRVEGLWKREKKADGTPDGEATLDGEQTAAPATDVAPTTPTTTPTEAAAPSADDAVKNGVIQEFVSSTTEAFESWQKRVDERIKEAASKAPGKSDVVDGLKRRVEELELKIAALEEAKKKS
ncbi:MAG: polyhydroxyalkanoate synthesis regulator DNA-binding domain-containing protein [Deltaproteobacteria bacterium]|nr:polyhydroxyalkanoate synthesis regulator DNA-binding domain-containing protein [Deltaproteobacteria bacterium]